MAPSKKLLSRDEVVVRHMRTHVKILLWRIIAQVAVLVAAVAATVTVPDSWGSWVYLVIWGLVLVVSVPLLALPWARWYAATYTITTKRVITRAGVLRRTGHDLPLGRISDVQQDKDLNDRFFGCGTLILQTSSDDPLRLRDVPRVDTVQLEIANLLFDDAQGAIDADPRS